MSSSVRDGGHKRTDANFASITSLDSSGGWHVLRIDLDGAVTADAAANKVLQQFFAGEADWADGLPLPLAETFFESRNWGMSRQLSRSWRSFATIQAGLKLTANFVPDPQGGYVILKAGPIANAVAISGLPLTQREQDIVALVATGKTNAEIGIILSISARTVQKHLENIFRRLGVETRMALIARVST